MKNDSRLLMTKLIAKQREDREKENNKFINLGQSFKLGKQVNKVKSITKITNTEEVNRIFNNHQM